MPKHLHPLRQYRKAHRLNCDELGKKLGFAGSTIRSYENGTRVIDAETALLIEKRLAIPRETIRSDLWTPA